MSATSNPTTEQMREAVAESLGWKFQRYGHDEAYAWCKPDGTPVDTHKLNGRTVDETRRDMWYCVPPFDSDLNAAHEMENCFAPFTLLFPAGEEARTNPWNVYVRTLVSVCQRTGGSSYRATAAERCEAFLRVKRPELFNP